MGAKTKIVVLHMKELIYTAVFIVLGILLIVLLVTMFGKKEEENTVETMKYVPGVYSSSIMFNDSTIDVQVVVDEDHINSVEFINLDETVATMYPLMQTALKDIADQIISTQSLDTVTYSTENQYTSQVLLNAIEDALEKAETEAREKL